MLRQSELPTFITEDGAIKLQLRINKAAILFSKLIVFVLN